MRALPFILALLPTALFAEDIPLTTEVTAVTLYPGGASVTREVPFSVSSGGHQLILTDLPRSTPLGSVRVAVEGAVMGQVSARKDFVPPHSAETDARIAAAEAEVERIEDELRTGRAEIEEIRLGAEAARTRVAFLKDLGRSDGVAALETGALRSLVDVIGEETLTALQAAHEASRRADEAERGLEDLQEELERAQQALAALVPEEEDRAMLAVSVRSDAPAEGTLTVTYNIADAGWQPVYDLRLDRGSGALAIERGALVHQSTGENWTDTAVTLSTVRPSEQISPAEVWPVLRRIVDPDDLRPKPLARTESAADGAGFAEMAEPARVEAAAQFDGLSVTYNYPDPVSVASGADMLRLTMGTLEAEADLVAQAAPLSDSTAFLVASFTNDSEELILPTPEASFYLDGRFVGNRPIDLIPAGGEADLAFGPVEGLRLTRTVLGRNEGDRGLITRSTELAEEVKIEVENLTGEAWPLRVIDRVPYSEQTDLEITWQASPRVSEQDVDGKRGVLAWEFELPAGESRIISLSHKLKWPEGKLLR